MPWYYDPEYMINELTQNFHQLRIIPKLAIYDKTDGCVSELLIQFKL